MSPATLALVLASAVIHATWNLWLKQIGGATRGVPLIWLLTAISAVIYAPIALTFASRVGWHFDRAALVLIAGSGVIHVVYFVLLRRGYRAGDLSLVYPLARGIGPLVATIGAVALFHEKPTALSVAGVALVITGIVVLTANPSEARHPTAAIGYGVATGLTIAFYTLWDGWAVKRAGLAPLLYYWCGECVRVVLLAPAALHARAGVAQVWREHRGRVFAIGALSPLSYILILLALRQGAVGHVAPAREVSILIGAWLGGWVLGEGQRARRLVAATAFAAGVFALATA